MTGVLTLYRTTIGKKALMAITGFILIAFVVGHMVGNLKVFLGAEAINSYAGFLRDVGEPLLPRETLLWIARLVLLASVGIHTVMAYQLSRKDWEGRPVHYASKKTLQASYASLTMRWGGVILVLFIIYHILHLTLGKVGYSAAAPFTHEDPNNGYQTYSNIVNAFQSWPVTLFYVLAMGALCLHLYHGTWSMIQTLGLNSYRYNGMWRTVAAAVAIVSFVGFIVVPLAALFGFLPPA
jgi:succinate dehydrogenase / fumarate reductase cytochrome b subunit